MKGKRAEASMASEANIEKGWHVVAAASNLKLYCRLAVLPIVRDSGLCTRYADKCNVFFYVKCFFMSNVFFMISYNSRC